MKKCLDCFSIKSDKGLYCKPCGYKYRKRPSGLKYNLVVVNPTTFKKGQKPWNKGLPYLQIRDDKNNNWKGDQVGNDALHDWVKRRLGKANQCTACGVTGKSRYHWHNISMEYKRVLSDWKELCCSCHRKIHLKKEKVCVR